MKNLCFSLAVALLVPSAQAATEMTGGEFKNASVLELVGKPQDVVYAVSFDRDIDGLSVEGYEFQRYLPDGDANLVYEPNPDRPAEVSFWKGMLAKAPETDFERVLNCAALLSKGTFVLQHLEKGENYKLLVLLADTRTTISPERGATVFLDDDQSDFTPYSFQNGEPALGGYVLATFKAGGTTQAFRISTPGNDQINAIVVARSKP